MSQTLNSLRLASVARLLRYSAEHNAPHAQTLQRLEQLAPKAMQPSVHLLRALQNNQTDPALTKHYPLLELLQQRINANGGKVATLFDEYQMRIGDIEPLVYQYWNGLRSIFHYVLAITVVAVFVFGFFAAKIFPTYLEAFDNIAVELPAFTLAVMGWTQHLPIILLILAVLLVLIISTANDIKKCLIQLLPFNQSTRVLPVLSSLRTTYHYYLFLQYCEIFLRAGLTPEQAYSESRQLAKIDTQRAPPTLNTLMTSSHLALQIGVLPQEIQHQKTLLPIFLSAQLTQLREAITTGLLTLTGIVVGGLLIAMYLPIFALGNVAH